MLKLLRS